MNGSCPTSSEESNSVPLTVTTSKAGTGPSSIPTNLRFRKPSSSARMRSASASSATGSGALAVSRARGAAASESGARVEGAALPHAPRAPKSNELAACRRRMIFNLKSTEGRRQCDNESLFGLGFATQRDKADAQRREASMAFYVGGCTRPRPPFHPLRIGVLNRKAGRREEFFGVWSPKNKLSLPVFPPSCKKSPPGFFMRRDSSKGLRRAWCDRRAARRRGRALARRGCGRRRPCESRGR
jgi:hypothetical protein